MQNLRFGPPPPLGIILALSLATLIIGVSAARVSAQLAHGSRPGGRRSIWTVAACGLLTASAAVARPQDLAWSLGLGWTLVVLASVDLAVLRLPDVLTVPLAGAGLVYAVLVGGDLGGHAAGLLVGYGSIAVTGWMFARLRRRRGIGLGDAKLFAAAGAWLGWAALPSVMLIACGLGLAGFAVIALKDGRGAFSARAPFGVALCCGAWVIWLLG